MAHFAEIDNEDVVLRVIVVNDSDTIDESGNELEAVGAAFCNNLLGGIWKQTSFNSNIRKNYAGIGFTYDEDRDVFIPPKPYNKWILNEETCQWEAPVPYPQDDKDYIWNDNKGEWEEMII